MAEQLRSIRRRVIVEREKLKREIGTAALFSAGYGNVGSSIYYALGATAAFALGATPLALGLAGIFFIFTVWSFAEGATMMPYAGGANYFSRKGMNESVSFFTGWIDILTYIVTISISAYTAVKYLAYFIPALAEPVPVIIGEMSFRTDPDVLVVLTACLFVLALMGINILGVKQATSFNIFFAVIDLCSLTLIITMGFLLALNIGKILQYPHLGPQYWPTLKGFVMGFAVAMISYTGIDTIAQMSEEAQDHKKTIPRAYILLILVVLVVSLSMPLIATSLMDPPALAGEWKTNAIAGVAFYMPSLNIFGLEIPLKSILGPWVGFLALMILLMATNAGIMGASRLAYSMGEHRQLPSFVFKLHRKFNTPYITVMLFSVIAVVLLLFGIFVKGIFVKLASLYAFSAMLIFAMAHLSIIALRIRMPKAERTFKIPFNIKIMGRLIPVPAVLGFIINVIVWIIIIPSEGGWVRNIGFTWIIAGFILYVLYRKKHNLPVHDEVKIERVVEAAYQPVDFAGIIVPTTGDLEAATMQTACKIALRDKSRILAMYVIEVPMTLPVKASIPVEREKGEKALDQAEMIAKEYGLTIDTRLVQTRSAGRAIVEEAHKRKADLVLLGQTGKLKSAEILSGKTVSYVAKHAPCKVLIDISENA